VPDSWNADVYQHRAEAWRQKAALLSESKEVAICLEIAEGYAKLASALKAKSSASVVAILPIRQLVNARNSRRKIAPAREA
jgi:hypothetical protein